MTILYLLMGLVIVATILFLINRQHNRHLNKIDDLIKHQAKNKGLKIKSTIYPTFKDWKDDPFEREIKIGTLGFHGIPTNVDYFRILNCIDISSDLPMTFWVKITNNRRTSSLTTEWREKKN